MKIRSVIIAFLFLSFSVKLQAQDKLLDRQGNEFLVKVLEISPDSVYYKHFPDSANATTYVIPKATVFMITYQNGVKEVFQEAAPVAAETEPAMSGLQLYNRGRADANILYKGRHAFWLPFAATVLYPPAGLGVGTGMALARPARHTFIASDPNLLDQPEYVDGYGDQAKKQRLGKAAAGFGAGIGVYITVFAILFSGALN